MFPESASVKDQSSSPATGERNGKREPINIDTQAEGKQNDQLLFRK